MLGIARGETSAADQPAYKKALLLTGALVAGIGLGALLDHPIQEKLFPTRNNDPSEDLRLLGDKGQLAGPVIGAGFLLAGIPSHHPYATKTGVLLIETYALSGAACGLIKFAVGRRRPSITDHAASFRPGITDGSFPSGHTTVAFSAATMLSERYPKWYIAIPAYGVAAGVGFSRMYANQHWLTDVLAGAGLGWSVSHWLNKRATKVEDKDSAWMFNGEQLTYLRRF